MNAVGVNMLRVCVDGIVFENDYQIGIWRTFYEVMARLSSQVDFRVLLSSENLQALPPGVRCASYYARRRIARWNLLQRARRRWTIRHPKRNTTRSSDVYHSTYYTPSPIPDVPVVVTVYDMTAEQLFPIQEGLLEGIRRKREAILSAAICIAISSATARDLVAFIPEVADRIRVVHLGADHLIDGRRATNNGRVQKDGDQFALFVGNRWGYKNFYTVLESLRSPAWPQNVQLRVVGGLLSAEERRLIEVRGLTDRIRMLGRLSDEELRNQYATAACFVFPSLMEGFGLPVLEAQANGCPVVLSDIPVFREIAGEGALYFDPRLGERLAETVARVCDPRIGGKLAEAGLANVGRFSWATSAEQTQAVYEEAARGNGQQRANGRFGALRGKSDKV